MKPAMGEVAAEDFVLICVRFTPSAVKKYVQLLRCRINGEISGKLMLEGAGAVPFLLLPDMLLDDGMAGGRLIARLGNIATTHSLYCILIDAPLTHS